MATNQRKVGQDRSGIVTEIPAACADETAAVEFFERHRWGDSPRCARCNSENVYQMTDAKTGNRNRRYLWRCRDCKKQYTVRVGMVMEDSRVPLRHWCYALWRSCTSKKGVSALEIKRQTGLTYKSALFLMHRIRFAMAPASTKDGGKLSGTVEVDETYFGGTARQRHPNNPRGTYGKQAALGMVGRDGRVRVRVVPDVTAATLKQVDG